MLVEVSGYPNHTLAGVGSAFCTVGGSELKNIKDMVLNCFFDDEVEMALALLAEQRGEAVQMIENEFPLLELNIKLEDGGGSCKACHGALSIAACALTMGPGAHKAPVPFAVLSNHAPGMCGSSE